MARVHVVLSDEVLKAVDAVAGKRGRSRFFEGAAKEKLERLALAESLRATAGIARGRPYRHWRDR
jgi:metal-responsive CopG/Arc/MetJ family transcriptional regulator